MEEKRKERSDEESDVLIAEIEITMLNAFEKITRQEGREIVNQTGVPLTPNLRILDALSFDSIMKDMRLQRPHFPRVEHITSGMYYSKDLGVLARWDFASVRKEGESSSGGEGHVIIQRVADAKLSDTTRNLKEQVSYVHDVALNKEKRYENIHV